MPTKDLGAPDPELRNSPIRGLGDTETGLPEEHESGFASCWFNEEEFPHGTEILSGNAMLYCHHGVWITAGPTDATYV